MASSLEAALSGGTAANMLELHSGAVQLAAQPAALVDPKPVRFGVHRPAVVEVADERDVNLCSWLRSWLAQLASAAGPC